MNLTFPFLIFAYLGIICVFVGHVACHKPLIPPAPLVTDTPYFDSSMSKKLITHVGKTTDLHCRVHSIGNRTVSWIRTRDLRILTVNRYTYTTDLRHEILHKDGTNQWTLRIKYAQLRDAGVYECQISTRPVDSFPVELIVLEPRVEILGAPDLYIQRRSMINLTCIMHDVPEPPVYVMWYHNNKNISYNSERGGISLVVEKGPTTISNLLIQHAQSSDSGFYTCAPAGMTPANVTVHALNGEHPAAMQVNSSSSSMVLYGESWKNVPSFFVSSLFFYWCKVGLEIT